MKQLNNILQSILQSLHNPIQELTAVLTPEKLKALELNNDEQEFLNGTVLTSNNEQIQKTDSIEEAKPKPLVDILKNVIQKDKKDNFFFNGYYGIPLTIMLNTYLSQHQDQDHSEDFLAILASITHGNKILATLSYIPSGLLRRTTQEFANQLRSKEPRTAEEKLDHWNTLTWGTERPSHNITTVDFNDLIKNLIHINKEADTMFESLSPLEFLINKKTAATTAPSTEQMVGTHPDSSALDPGGLLTSRPIKRKSSRGSFSTSTHNISHLNPAVLRTSTPISTGQMVDPSPNSLALDPGSLLISTPIKRLSSRGSFSTSIHNIPHLNPTDIPTDQPIKKGHQRTQNKVV